jgi:hypothetical protein
MAQSTYTYVRTPRGPVLECAGCGAQLEVSGLTAGSMRDWSLAHDGVCPAPPLPEDQVEGG